MNYYYEDILKVSRYIEENLDGELEIKDIIDRIGFSQFHFMRVFRALSGHTISNYIMRRRMTEAAKALLNTNMRIIDIAFQYGYQSQEAFTRAFKEVYDVTPNAYRKAEIAYRNLEQVVLNEELLQIKLSEVIPIQPQIVYKDPFQIVGMKYRGKNENLEIAKLWNLMNEEIDKIMGRRNKDICYGIECYYENSHQDGIFEYIAGVEVEETATFPPNMEKHEVKHNKYAVFPIKALIETVPQTIGRIYSVHLPNSGLKAVSNFDFECYDESFEANNHESVFSFYIPVE